MVRLLAKLCPALILLACGPGPVDQIRFVEPQRVQVKAGTAIEALAKAHQVGFEELRRWNGLTGKVVEEDCVLLVWPSAVEPKVAAASTPPAPKRQAPARSRRGKGSKPSAPSSGGASQATVEAQKLVVSEPVVVVAPPEARINLGEDRPTSVRSAGVLHALGALDQGGTDLAEEVAALERRGQVPGQVGLKGSRNLVPSGEAEALTDIGRTPRTHIGPEVGTAAVRAPKLPMPAPKPCLAAPSLSDPLAESATVGNRDLTEAQVSEAMARFVPKTLACIPRGTRGNYEITTEIRVGCDGRVKDVWIIDRGVLPEHVAACIAETLHYAGFPAHAVPDGFVFAYPIVYRY